MANKKSKRKSTGLSLGSTVASASIPRQFGGRPMDKKYAPLVKKAMALKKGQSFLVSMPEGDDLARFRQRISSVVERHVKPRRSEVKFTVFRTEDGKVAIQAK